MIHAITEWILALLRTHGAWSVFLGVLIEQIIVPIPSPAIVMGAGAILIPFPLSWGTAFSMVTFKIVLPGTAASLIGAVIMYYLGLWGGKIFVDKCHKFLGFTWADVEAFDKKIPALGGPMALFPLRAIPIVPLSLVSLVAGVMEMSFKAYLFWSALGTIVRCYLLGFMGWQLGAQALNWAKGVDRYESFVSLGIVFVVIGLIFYIRRKVNKPTEIGN